MLTWEEIFRPTLLGATGLEAISEGGTALVTNDGGSGTIDVGDTRNISKFFADVHQDITTQIAVRRALSANTAPYDELTSEQGLESAQTILEQFPEPLEGKVLVKWTAALSSLDATFLSAEIVDIYDNNRTESVDTVAKILIIAVMNKLLEDFKTVESLRDLDDIIAVEEGSDDSMVGLWIAAGTIGFVLLIILVVAANRARSKSKQVDSFAAVFPE